MCHRGTDMQVAKNERKAVRMLEELQALKVKIENQSMCVNQSELAFLQGP